MQCCKNASVDAFVGAVEEIRLGYAVAYPSCDKVGEQCRYPA